MTDKGPIVFLGSTNAMPMMYALELRRRGYEVLYVVGRKQSDALHRPENHFPDIHYPYPDWIIEMPIPSQALLATFPRYYARRISKWVTARSDSPPVCYITNGFFTAVHPYLSKGSLRIGLTHGADLIQWGDPGSLEQVHQDFSDRSIFRLFPQAFSKVWMKKIIQRQRHGFESLDYVIGFVRGINPDNDRLVNELESLGVRYIPRLDVSFLPLEGQPREYKEGGEVLNIFSGVRFHYKKMVGDRKGRSKGNRQIIEALADLYKENPNIEVHFVEKGEDIDDAKALCRELGLEPCIIWHPEMPFSDLLELYRNADICFDQVGDHWISAIGMYALWLGKPLIANDRNLIDAGFWPATNPVFSAMNSETVLARLRELQNPSVRQRASRDSTVFAEQYVSCFRVAGEVQEIIDGSGG